eukprot:TRINITY_DN7162_c0_g1_i1.p1 TRINITY_DN7162_c0_g1~~TRINITY_DN7162_c0_g1_i1.p1  ORF type:complete len:262 (+),score=62.71 TRINITY_DN7162_c0_g1_i1:60-845(+)
MGVAEDVPPEAPAAPPAQAAQPAPPAQAAEPAVDTPMVCPERSVAVSGLSAEVTQSDLEDFFVFCGDVSHVVLKPGSAVVVFADPGSVETALMLTGAVVRDSVVTVAPVRVVEQGSGAAVDRAAESARSATDVLGNMIQAGYVQGATLITTLRKRAEELDEKHGIRQRAAGAVSGVTAGLSSPSTEGSRDAGAGGGGGSGAAAAGAVRTIVDGAKAVGGAVVGGVKGRMQGPQPPQQAVDDYTAAGARQWNQGALASQPQW